MIPPPGGLASPSCPAPSESLHPLECRGRDDACTGQAQWVGDATTVPVRVGGGRLPALSRLEKYVEWASSEKRRGGGENTRSLPFLMRRSESRSLPKACGVGSRGRHALCHGSCRGRFPYLGVGWLSLRNLPMQIFRGCNLLYSKEYKI